MDDEVNCTGVLPDNGEELVFKDSSERLKKFSLFLLIIVPIYSAVCVGAFLYFRNRSYWLYKRNTPMLLVFAIGSNLTLFAHAYRHHSGSFEFNCGVLFLLGTLSYMFTFLPFITRIASILLRIRFNRTLINYNFMAVSDGSFTNSVPIGREAFVTSKSKDFSKSSTPAGFSTFQFDQERSQSTKKFESFLFKISCWSPPEHVPSVLRLKLFFSLNRVVNFFLTIFVVGGGAIFLVSQDIKVFQCRGCGVDQAIPLYVALCCFFLFVGAAVFACAKKSPDGLGVRHEMKLIAIAVTISNMIFLPLSLVFSDYEKDGVFCWSFIMILHTILVMTISFPYQIYIALYKRVSVSADNTSIEEILSGNDSSKAFALYLTTSLCVENIFFYKAVTKWKEDNLKTVGDVTNSALVLYDNFISYDGPFTINIPHTIRNDIVQRREAGNLEIDMYDEALDSIVELLSGDAFQRFKSSIYYSAYKGNIGEAEMLNSGRFN